MVRSFLFLSSIFFFASCGNNDQTTEASTTTKRDSVTTAPSPSSSTSTPAANDSVNQSLAVMEKRHALVPSDPELAYDLAYAYAEAGNAKALRIADSLIKAKAPQIEKAYYSKADYYARLNNVKEAVKNYDNALAANLHFLDAQIDKGRLLFHQKQYNEALKAFAIGQKISPSEPMFYFWIAKTQEAMGNKQDAKTNYERAYALDKTLTEAKQAADKL